MLSLSTHFHGHCKWRESDFPACGPPANFSVHLASVAVTPAGSVHNSRGDNVVKYVGEVEEIMWVVMWVLKGGGA